MHVVICPRSPEFNVARCSIQAQVAKVGVFCERVCTQQNHMSGSTLKRGGGGRRICTMLRWAFFMKTPVHFSRWCIHHISIEPACNFSRKANQLFKMPSQCNKNAACITSTIKQITWFKGTTSAMCHMLQHVRLLRDHKICTQALVVHNEWATIFHSHHMRSFTNTMYRVLVRHVPRSSRSKDPPTRTRMMSGRQKS